MNNLTSSFSACSDGSVALSVSCKGPDCGSLQGFPGLSCITDGNTTTCSSGAGCSESSGYSSSLELLDSNSTFYATNALQFDCETDTFVVNKTLVGPLVTDASACLNGTSNGTLNGTSTSGGSNSTQSVRYSPAPTVTFQQSSGSSIRWTSKRYASFSVVILSFMVMLSLLSPIVAAHETNAHHHKHLHLRDGSPSLPASQSLQPEQGLQARGFIGPAITDVFFVSTWYDQIQSWIQNSPNGNILNSIFNPSSSQASFWSDLLSDTETFACQVLLDYVETNLINNVLFRQQWKQCTANIETDIQRYLGPNTTSVKITPGLTIQFVAAAKVACDVMFSKLIQDILGFDPENQICGVQTSPPLSGPGSSTGSGSGSTPRPTPTPVSTTTTVDVIYAYQDDSTCTGTYHALGQSESCCGGEWVSQDTSGKMCADTQNAPSCPSDGVVLPLIGGPLFVDTGVICDTSFRCDWFKLNYQYQCCDCPPGYVNVFQGGCWDQYSRFPYGPCAGCEDPAATLVGDLDSGYQCVM